jgi:hypothetical protein
MIDLGHDQCSRCQQRISSHDPMYTEWEDIDGLAVCPDCLTPQEWAAFDEVVMETRCGRCGSLIFAETIDVLADIPNFEADGQLLCTSCSAPDGRVA